MVGQVCGRVRLSADADPDPGKLVVSQVLNDILQPVVTAGRAALAYAQLAQLHGNIVADNNDVIQRYLIEIHCGAHSVAGQVHVGLGLHQQCVFTLFA